MRVVTARYAAFRQRNINSLLSWHSRNEYALYGYITPSTKPIKKPFRISRFLDSGEYHDYYYDEDGELLRYDSSLEIVDWQCIRNPWESDEDEALWLEREFYTIEQKEKYLLDGVMLDAQCESRGIMYPPFGCLPIGWMLKNGKVTLW